MALLKLSDLEEATNQEICADDVPYYEWYIDAVSAFLSDYTGQDFEAQEDVTITCDSGKYGLIQLPGLIDITSVSLFDRYAQTYTALQSAEYCFDGVDTIYDLCVYQTYQLVVSYGWTEVPDSVKAIATQLVAAGSGLDPAATNGLVMKRVGDREEQYGVSSDDSSVTVTSLQAAVLAKYRGAAWTYRV